MVTVNKLYLFCALLSAHNVCCMKLEHARKNTVDQVMQVLPELTLFEEWSQAEYITWSMQKTTSFSANYERDKDQLYKKCFTDSNTLSALTALCKPRPFTWTKSVDGQLIEEKKMLQFPLAHLARGFLLLQQDCNEEAVKAFQAAQAATHKYRMHEEPIACAARFQVSLAHKNLDEAFQALTRLKVLSKMYTSFNALAVIQEQQLVDAGYAPLVNAKRCTTIKELLLSKHKFLKLQGLKESQELLTEYLKSSNDEFKKSVESSGVFEALTELSVKGNPSAAFMLLQKAYHTLFETVATLDETVEYNECKAMVKLCPPSALLPNNDRALVDKFQGYARAVIALKEENYDLAAGTFLELLSSKSKNSIVQCMRERAQGYLEQLSLHGQFDARCYVLGNSAKDTVKKNTEYIGAECVGLLEQALEAAPAVHSSSMATLLGVATQLANAGNVQVSYLMSRYYFNEAHKDCQKTGLSPHSTDELNAVFKYAAKARTGVPCATAFTQAVILYRGALGMLKENKFDQVVDPLLKLLQFEGLDDQQKQLCASFARFQLEKIAKDGGLLASKWQITQDLDVPSKRAHALKSLGNALGKLLASEISPNNIIKQKNILADYVQFGTFTKIGNQIIDESLDPNIRAQSCHIMSLCRQLERLINTTMNSDKEPLQEALLLEAVDLSKKACTLVTDNSLADTFRLALGNLYCALGVHYLQCMCVATEENEYLSKCLGSFSEGVRLQNPSCMRALAATMLEQRNLTESLFEVYVKMLHDAYTLGDKVAGALLADHYFEGPAGPFGCGKSLKRDIDKASRYAREVGREYSQTKRLCAYIEYCRLSALRNAKQAKKIDLGSVVKDLMETALEGEDRAYEHLTEICISSAGSEKVSKDIVAFLRIQSQKDIPAAYCALGCVLLMDIDGTYVCNAQSYFEKAIALSNGTLGLFEMTHLHSKYTQNLLEAAKYCIRMLTQDTLLKKVDSNHAQATAQVLSDIYNFQGDDQVAPLLHQYSKNIRVLLDRLNIKLKINEKLVDVETQEEVINCCNELVPEMLIEGVKETFGTVSDKIVRLCGSDVKAINSFKVTAQKGNPFAHFVLSKIYVAQAQALHRTTPYCAEEFDLFCDALVHVTEACNFAMPKQEYLEQFVSVYIKSFEYLNYSLVHELSSQQQLDAIFDMVKNGLNAATLPHVLVYDKEKQLELGARECLCLLVQLEHAPSIALQATLPQKV